MPAIAAKNCQLAIRSNQSPYPFLPLAGVDNINYTLQHDPAPSPHVGDDGWRIRQANSRSSQLSVRATGIANSHDADSQLRQHAIDRTASEFQLTLGDGSYIYGHCIVQEYGYQAGQEGLARFTLLLISAGTISFTPSA